jgi:hypothetical protein
MTNISTSFSAALRLRANPLCCSRGDAETRREERGCAAGAEGGGL